MLGLNGSGKSTLLRIMAGRDTDFAGEAWAAEGASVGFLPQEPALDPGKDVLDNIMEGVAEKKALLDKFERRQRPLRRAARRRRDGRADRRAGASCRRRSTRPILGPRPHRRDRHGCPALPAAARPRSDTLSGGERRRVALCRLLLQKPDLLLLDEPTNHLDAESVAWLERFLQDYKGTVVAVTHDRYFLDNVAGWILELDRGKGIPWEGQLFLLAGAEGEAAGAGGEDRDGAPADLAARTGVDPQSPARAPGEEQGAHHRL